MSVKITNLEGSKVRLEFVVEKEKFNEAIDEAFKKNSGKFKLPGFRNGKVPRNVIEKTYGEGVMLDEAFNIVAEKEYAKAIEDNKLTVVSHPEIDIKEIGKDKNLEFSIEVYLKPEAKLKEYKGLTIEKASIEVTDDDVKNELENIRAKNARIIQKEDGTVENGDVTVIDFEGFLDGVSFEGGKAEKYELEIGSGAFIPGFEEQLIGMKIGEDKEITTTFPENYGNADLAGKSTIFKIHLHEMKKKELPVLDDEFAKDISEFETLKEYTENVKEKLVKSKEITAKAERETKSIAKLVENVEVEIPEPMIEHEIEHMLGEFEQNLAYQGMNLEQYKQILNIDDAALKAQFRENAIKDIKLRLALELIEKEENIEITDDEINTKIDELSKTYGKDAEPLKKNPNVKQYMTEKLKQEKAMDVVVSSIIEK